MEEFIHKIIQPKVILFLMLVPFGLIMPLIGTTLIFGFPYPYVSNNQKLNNYEEFFEGIAVPESVTVISPIYSKVQQGFDLPSRCSLFTGHIVKSSSDQNAFSKEYLKNYQEEVASYIENENTYQLIFDAKFKIIPILIDEPFKNNDTELNLRHDFDLKDFDINSLVSTEEETEKLYVVYVMNKDVFSSTDFRCRGQFEGVPEEIEPEVQEE